MLGRVRRNRETYGGRLLCGLFLLPLMALLVFSSCSTTRRLQEGQYLLVKNVIEEDKDVPRKERISRDEVERYANPTPNRKFLGTKLYLQFYNLANPDTTKKNWLNRTLRKLGDAPVLVNESDISKSARYMNNYLINSGYYFSDVTYDIEYRKKKAVVTYNLHQGEPYRIRKIEYFFMDESLRPVIQQDSARTLLRPGEILDDKVLGAERKRIVDNLRNSGYYDFYRTNIDIRGDTTVGDYMVDLYVVFRGNVAGHDNDGLAQYENNSVYRVSRIVIDPDFNPMTTVRDSDYYMNLDTTEYRGLYILHPKGKKPKVRPKVLRQAVTLYPNYLYSQREAEQAINNILLLGYYRNTSIVFDRVEPDSTELNEITFIGGDDEDDGETAIESTTERYLTARINCIPPLKQSYKIELEGTTSSNFHAINATVGYQNRNLFRGVELLDLSFKGGYEFVRAKGEKGSFEIGGSASMSFPRFITPFKVDRYNRATNPKTRVELSINTQRRVKYHRTLSSASWGYSWNFRAKNSISLRPVDINYVKLGYIDRVYFESLKSEYLRQSYRSQVIVGMSGSYTYNAQLARQGGFTRKSFLFRFNWENAGNLLNLISKASGAERSRSDDGNHYNFLGVPYAQYFRVDLSVSDKITLGPQTNIAFRLFGGVGMAYSNSRSLPFDRLFYAGGTNSMRGWIPRRLGPGNLPPDDPDFPNQTGDMKLEANMEFRFPAWDRLKSAVFFDLGNTWFVREKTSGREAAFRFNNFYRQLGFNTGLGFRYDIGVTVIRLDWGIRLHDPNKLQGDRWISTFKLSNTVLNFGVGYPF